MELKHRVALITFFSCILGSLLFHFVFLSMGAFIIIWFILAGLYGHKIIRSICKRIFNYNIDNDIKRVHVLLGVLMYGLIYILLLYNFSANVYLANIIATICTTAIAYKASENSLLVNFSRSSESTAQLVQNNGSSNGILDKSKQIFNEVARYKFKNTSVIPTGDADYTLNDITHGSAIWMSDVQKELHTDNERGTPTFKGLWIGGGFFHNKEGNLLSVAPPGKGKGAALIIPNLLWEREYPHSFIVFDPKGTNACITARFQRDSGQRVYIIDPMGLQEQNNAQHGIESSSFNPLDFIKDDIYNGAGLIANLFIPDEPENKNDKFWVQKARDLFQGVLMHIMTAPEYENNAPEGENKRNLVTLYRLFRGGDLDELLMEMGKNDDALLGEEIAGCGEEFQRIKGKGETFNSILATITNAISWLGNPKIQATIKSSSFNPAEIANGRITIYLCQPIQNKEQFATFSRLIVGIILRENSKPSAKPKAWVYYLLDEFPSMGIFPEVISSLALAREYKMRIWIFAQSLSQLDTIYTPTGRETIVGTTNILQAFGVTDRLTQEYISSRIGHTTIVSENISESKSLSKTGDMYSQDHRVDKSTQKHSRRLLMEEEIERESNIITLTEWGPMKLSRWQYWQQPIESVSRYYHYKFKDRNDKNPNFN